LAIKTSDLYIDDGLIVTIQPRGGPHKGAQFKGKRAGSLLGFPMVCLVNGDSAYSSEIVAAALQDHKRAFLIGERNKWRCSVQNVRDHEIPAPETGYALKAEIVLTTAEFKRPNGQTLNRSRTSERENAKWGVVPDKVVALTAQERGNLADHLRRLE